MTTFSDGLFQFGGQPVGPILIPPGANCVFVHSGRGNDGNTGLDALKPLATADAAVGKCLAGQGDTIVCLPGHAENLAGATSFVCDVAGIQIIGLGEGNLLPTFTTTAAAGTISITAANVAAAAGSTVADGTAGEAVTQGQTLYKHTDGKLYKALADTAAHAAAVGIALNAASANQPVRYLTAGGINPGAAVVVGTIYGVTDTAGGIGAISERSTADYITILGIATTTSNINVVINKSGVAVPA
jgi:hypothetical protein